MIRGSGRATAGDDLPALGRRRAQPIAVEDVIAYLAAALDLPAGAERIYEIGGPDRVTYGDLMREYARQRGLKQAPDPGAACSRRGSRVSGSVW